MGTQGLTGRRSSWILTVVRAPHGGGAFSGKDPTKVDRSAAYVARYLAMNVNAVAGMAKRCVIQVAYAIGVLAAGDLCRYLWNRLVPEARSKGGVQVMDLTRAAFDHLG